MSEIINLAKDNGDDHVYEAACKIISDKMMRHFSFVIKNWNKPLPKTKFPIIVFDTSDEQHQLPEYAHDDNILHVFKQYHPMQQPYDPRSVVYHRKVSGIPLCSLKGVVDLDIPMSNRVYDWCWMGQFDPYRRADFKIAVDRLCENKHLNFKCSWYRGWNNGVSKQEYSEVLCNTKIALCPCGSASLETFRFFEAMMCGCVVIGVDLPRTAFYNNADYIQIYNWNTVESLIHKTLSDPKKMENYSLEAKKWYRKYCSPEGIADYVLARLET